MKCNIRHPDLCGAYSKDEVLCCIKWISGVGVKRCKTRLKHNRTYKAFEHDKAYQIDSTLTSQYEKEFGDK